MKSTLRIDFKGGDAIHQGFEPVIRVKIEDSEDSRDGLVSAFFEQLAGQSSWLAVDFNEHIADGKSLGKFATISVVKPDELKETMSIIRRRLGDQDEEPRLPSRFQIGQQVDFTTPKAKEYAYDQAKLLPENEGKTDSDIEYIPEYFWGKIVAVKFTESKVWYDVLDDYSGKVFDGIPSHDVKFLPKDFSKRPADHVMPDGIMPLTDKPSERDEKLIKFILQNPEK